MTHGPPPATGHARLLRSLGGHNLVVPHTRHSPLLRSLQLFQVRTREASVFVARICLEVWNHHIAVYNTVGRQIMIFTYYFAYVMCRLYPSAYWLAFHRLSVPVSIFEVELVAVCPPGADKALANSLIRYLDRKDDGTTHYVPKVTVHQIKAGCASLQMHYWCIVHCTISISNLKPHGNLIMWSASYYLGLHKQ